MLQHMQPAVGADAVSAIPRAVPKNVVRATTRTLELTKLGHAVNFTVYQAGHLLGRLHVGLGALRWVPARTHKKAAVKRVPWRVFATMMKEWPFGSSVRSRLEFARGSLRWRAPGKKGAGRPMSWREFVRRMPKAKPAPAKRSARRSLLSTKPDVVGKSKKV